MVLFKKPKKTRIEDGILSFNLHSKYAHDEILGLLKPLSYDLSMQDKVASFISTVNGNLVSGKDILKFYTSMGWVHARKTASKYGMLYGDLCDILKENLDYTIKVFYENNNPSILCSPAILGRLGQNSNFSYDFASGTIKRLEELCNDTFTDLNLLNQRDNIAQIVELYRRKFKAVFFPSPIVVLRSEGKEPIPFLNKEFINFAFRGKTTLVTNTHEPTQKFELPALFREAVSYVYERKVPPLGEAEEMVVVNKLLTVYKEIGAIEARFGLSSLSMKKLENLLNINGHASFITDKGTFSGTDLTEALKALSPLDRMSEHFSYLLMAHNKGIIRSHVDRYLPYAKHLKSNDLFQEAFIGVINATRRFNPRAGIRFATYAGYCVDNAIQYALMSKDLTIPLGDHVYWKKSRANNATKLFFDENGRTPTDEELAEKVNCSVRAIKQLEASLKASETLSLEVLDKEDGKSLMRTEFSQEVKDAHSDGYTEYVDNDELITYLLKNVTPKEGYILMKRSGLGFDREYTLEEIGEEFSVSRERIRQIEKKAKEKLQKLAKHKKLF